MSKARVLAAAAIAVFALSVSAPASAAIVVATYTGTVISGNSQSYDPINGWQYGNLTGLAVSLAFTVDTSAASHIYGYNNMPYYEYTGMYGGSNYGVASPVTNVTATIGSQTFTFSGTSSSQIEQFDGTTFNEIYHYGYSNNNVDGPSGYTHDYGSGVAYVYNYGAGPIQNSLSQQINHNVQSGEVFYGAINTESYDYNSITGDYNRYYQQYIQFNPTNVVVTSAVPEPATWAMMLIGFAGVGFTLRRRSAARAAV